MNLYSRYKKSLELVAVFTRSPTLTTHGSKKEFLQIAKIIDLVLR